MEVGVLGDWAIGRLGGWGVEIGFCMSEGQDISSIEQYNPRQPAAPPR